jgi:uncharacterized protein with FMN-binding domain
MMKKRKGKLKMWIAIVVLGVIGAVLLGGILITGPARNEIKNLTIADLNFKTLRDGTYVGNYAGSKDHSRDAEVQVTVSSGKVTDIRILKGALDEQGKPAKISAMGVTIENLFSDVIDTQSLQVDVVSGATLTSKAHLKALESALAQAKIY